MKEVSRLKKTAISLFLCIVHLGFSFFFAANCCTEIIWHYDWPHETDWIILISALLVMYMVYRLSLKAQKANLIYAYLPVLFAISNFIKASAFLFFMVWLANKDGIDLRFYDIFLMQLGDLYLGWKYIKIKNTQNIK